MILKIHVLAVVGSVAVLLTACTTSPTASNDASTATTAPTTHAAQDSVTGTVAYRERVALPPTAVVQVQLQDVSLQDVAATILDSVTIQAQGRQVPLPFVLHYNPARIQPGNVYVVRARILTAQGKPLFVHDEAYPVLTNGQPKRVQLMLRGVE